MTGYSSDKGGANVGWISERSHHLRAEIVIVIVQIGIIIIVQIGIIIIIQSVIMMRAAPTSILTKKRT